MTKYDPVDRDEHGYCTGPEIEEPAERRIADHTFWAELAGLVADRGAVLFQELFVRRASRWYRLTSTAEVEAVRARLTPRARLLVWPDLSTGVERVLASLPDDLFDIVWVDAQGRITSREATYPRRGVAHAAARRPRREGHPRQPEARHPLLTAVLPDPEGVVRARWTP